MGGAEHKLLITGAAGQYGRIVVEDLLKRGTPPSTLLLLTRQPAKLAEYASQGVEVRQGSFDDPVVRLADTFAGAQIMLLISTSRAGARLVQHQTAIDAAVLAGVSHIVYTSIVSAGLDNPTALDMLKKSGVHWTALRDAQYAEAITDVAGPPALESGVMRVNAGEGRMGFVARGDCAAAAAAVLASPAGHRDQAYHITGPELLSWADTARIMGETAGKPLAYDSLSDEEQLAIFDAMGIPREPIDDLVVGGYPWNSADMISFARATSLGEMAVLTKDFETITGRAPKTFHQVCQRQLKGQQA